MIRSCMGCIFALLLIFLLALLLGFDPKEGCVQAAFYLMIFAFLGGMVIAFLAGCRS